MSAPQSPRTHAATLEGQLVAGKFRLERVLGEGGMGVVYAAVNLDLLKQVAIKLTRHELSTQVELVERMLEEARTVARLRSEHVAQVLDVGRLESGAAFIVMEYLDGCDLATKLSECGKLPVDVTVSYVLQACEAVAEAHAAGIVHRDIKPDNLFLTSRADGEPVVKVLDFGISKNLRGSSVEKLIVGSPDYMSPEALRGDPDVGISTDIWSIGAMLYELLTGRRPFDASSVAETCALVVDSEPMAMGDVSPELEAVVRRCLRKDAAARFSSVAELAKALLPFGPGDCDTHLARIERVAAGARWSPRPSPVPRRPSLGSFSDLPSSSPPSVTDIDSRPSSVPAAPQAPARWRTHVLGAVAMVSILGAGILFALKHSATADAAPTAAVAAVAAPPSVSASLAVPTMRVEVQAPLPTVIASAKPEKPSGPSPTKAGKSKAGARAPAATKGDARQAQASAEAAPAAPSVTSVTAAATTNAWNRDSFGGRK